MNEKTAEPDLEAYMAEQQVRHSFISVTHWMAWRSGTEPEQKMVRACEKDQFMFQDFYTVKLM